MTKWMARLLALTLAFALLMTGCSDTPAASGTSDGSRTGSGSTPDGSSPSDETMDLGGMEIVFTSMGPGFFDVDESSDIYDEMQDFIAEVETRFHCKLRFDHYGPWDVYFQKLQDMTMNGDFFGDIVAFDAYIYPSTLLNGIFVPIDEYINVKDYDLWEQGCEDFFTIKNRIYAVSAHSETLVPLYFCLYNKTLFEEKGLSAKYDLKSMVMNREWTWDKFREVMRASTLDTNGDGVTDIWGLSAQGYQFATLPNALSIANDAMATRKNGDSVKVTMNEAPYLETLEFVNKLTWEDKAVSTDDKWRGYDSFNKFALGESMFWIGTNWWVSTLQTMVDDTVFSVLPVPIGPNAGGEYIVRDKGNVHTFGMLSTCEHKKEAGAVFEYFMKNRPTDGKSVRASWSDMVFDTDSLDVIEMLSKLPHSFAWTDANTTSFSEVMLGEHGIPDRIPPATFVATVQDRLQADLDQLWSLADFD